MYAEYIVITKYIPSVKFGTYNMVYVHSDSIWNIYRYKYAKYVL
jgi:hypothetical protein